MYGVLLMVIGVIRMNRKALLLYLREIRDLEFAKHRIKNIYGSEQQRYGQKLNSLKRKEYVTMPDKPIVSTILLVVLGAFMIFGGIIGIIFMIFGETIAGTAETIFWIVPFGIVILMGVAAFVSVVQGWLEYFKKVKAVKRHNVEEKVRIHNNSVLLQQTNQAWNERAKYLKNELDKVNSLLKDYYGLNILANQYRNLASVYYIYDYMSSSQETFKDTLMHEHMENGIQRILEKLDYIIEQNQEIIFQNRIAEANSHKVLQQNEDMLNNLQRIESNTSSASHYAEVASYYSKANAYFSVAKYLSGK